MFSSSIRLLSHIIRSALLRFGVLFFVFTVFLFSQLAAQNKLLPVFHFNRLTTAEGLPSDNILSCVVRNSRGYVWIGTGNGLARYDGYGFKTYRNVLNDSSSLSSSMIMMVIERRTARIRESMVCHLVSRNERFLIHIA